MSFFSCTSSYSRSAFSASSSWRFSMSFFTCYRSCRLSCFSTSSYSRSAFSTSSSWRLSVSFFTSSRLNCRSTFSTSSYSWSFCVSFFSSTNSWSWGLSMSFTSSRLIYYRSCRLFSITSCWSSWSITCLICWFRCIFSSTIICINHEVRI